MHIENAHAIVGCGTVGGSVARLLMDDRDERRRRCGLDVYLKYIIDKDFTHARSLGLPQELFERDLQTALDDSEVRTIIELVGGEGFARELIARALKSGKHVITANKALLAHHGRELYAIARENGVCLAFEASCGGGIPIIRALTDGLVANGIDAIFGIVNGTCNYILTEMMARGQTYQQALKQAQANGLAEADPSLDVNGSDSAHKIAIMAGLAFGEDMDFDKIPITGIDRLHSADLAFGAEMGYTAKLIASAVKTPGGASLRVEPAFIAREHPLAWVAGSFNAISVYGHSVGHTMYYGRGAGGAPTASAVVADAISIANGSYPALFNSLQTWPDICQPARQIGPEEMQNRYYIRFQLEDHSGMLAKLTGILTQHSISVRSILQHEASGENVPLVITTHQVQEASVKKAVSDILKLDGVFEEHSILPIVDEHPEFSDT